MPKLIIPGNRLIVPTLPGPPDDLTPLVQKVQSYDKARFMVQSEEEAERAYLVSMDAYQGRGHCECPHFWGKLEAFARAFPDRHYACKHMRWVYTVFGRFYFRQMFAETEEDKPETGG